jgi:putative ABC transport system permease protein
MLLMQSYLQTKFSNDMRDIDLVIGAKGSPLQLVLSSVYHMDAPTGNIKLSELKTVSQNPMIEYTIPLAYGDSYKGYRILGTTPKYIDKYDGVFSEGRIFKKPLEAVIGYSIAQRYSLTINETFSGTHGESVKGQAHDNHAYTIVGILDRTNSVLDNLILTDIKSIWQMHAHDTDHADDDDHEFDESKMDITSALVKYKNKMALLMAPRNINQNTNMQAAVPTLEMNRLFNMIGIGTTTLKMIAAGIMFISGFSIFFVLYNRMRDRKYELAVLRTTGYRPFQLLIMTLSEGVMLAIIGFTSGTLLSRIGIDYINSQAAERFKIEFPSGMIPEEWYLLGITLLVGLIASLIPAIKAMRIDVSRTLSES